MSNINLNENVNIPRQTSVTVDNKGVLPSAKSENKFNLQTLQDDTYERIKRKKRRLTSMIAIGSTASLAAIAFIAVVTGKSQKISKKMQHLFGGVESKFSNVKDKHLHKILTTTFGLFDRFGKVLTNSSPIKDYTLHQGLGKTNITRSLRDSISKFFTNENKNSVTKSMNKSRESYNEFIVSLDKAISQSEIDPSLIKDKAKFEQLKTIRDKAKNTPDFLTKEYFEKNYDEMQKDMEYLSQEISFKRLFSKESLQGFVPEAILAERRAKYAKKLFADKNTISCTFANVSEYARTRLDDTNIIIYSIKDPKLQKNLKESSLNLDNSLKKFVKEASIKENREVNFALIKTNIQKLKNEVNSLSPSDVKNKLMVHMDEYEDLFKENKPGMVQEIRVLAGDVWGDKSAFDLSIKKSAENHRKNVNLSLTRMINMFDKQRDIVLGSGPADVLGILSPLAIFGYALTQADSKDKKVGTSLELGIPILGGMGVYVRTLALQYNGVRALATSVGTGILLNLVGSIVYKNYMHSQDMKKGRQRGVTPQQP